MREQLCPQCRSGRCAAGYTVLELLFVMAISATIAGLAVPAWAGLTERINTAAAARHVAGRLSMARFEAVRQSSVVGFRFDPQGAGYQFTPVVDGNGNGLRSADLTAGIDQAVGRAERLADQFRGADFGLLPGIPDIDGGTGNADGVRIGSSPFLSMSPLGTSTGGTLYIRGTRTQYAVRVFGATGRTRVFFFDPGARRWIAR